MVSQLLNWHLGVVLIFHPLSNGEGEMLSEFSQRISRETEA